MMPSQVHKFSNKHKTMCGYEACITANSMHTLLLAWCTCAANKLQKKAENAGNHCSSRSLKQNYESYRNRIMINGEHKYPKARQAAYAMLCECPNTENNLPHWKCVLGCCNNCPGMVKPAEEVRNQQDLPVISFHCYKNVTRCSIHGQHPFTEKKQKYLECEKLDRDDEKGVIF